MKKKIVSLLPFIIMLVFIPIYHFLDNIILVDIFGCGCVLSTQTNMLGIAFNANDLRLLVFSVLSIGLSIWSMIIARTFRSKMAKPIYCIAAILFNVLLTMWA